MKRLLTSALTVVIFLSGLSGLQAANVTWNKGTTTGSSSWNLNDSANWNGGAPANGNNVFLVISAGAPGGTQTITNAPTDTFFADSLSITNTSSKVDANITFRGQTFLTNGVGQLNFGGATVAGQFISLTFSNSLAFKTLNFTGGSGAATLTLAGATAGDNLIFNGGSGNNFLIISGALGLSDTLFATNINNTSAGTLSGNATVGRLILNNAANGRFTITNSTTTITGSVASVAAGFALANNATITLAGTGGLILSNLTPTINGTINVSNSTLNAQTVWSNNGTITVGGGTIFGSALTNLSTRNVSGFGTISNLLVNAGVVTATNGELRLANSVSGAGVYRAVAGSAGATLTFVNGGSISSLSNTGATVRIEGSLTNAVTFVNQGTVTLAGGTYQSTLALTNPAGFVVSGFGTLSAPFSNAGTLTATNGQLNVVLAPINTGTINISATGILNVTPAWTNNGTVFLSGGTLAGGNVTNLASRSILGWGTVSNLVVNSAGGTVTASNSLLTLASAPIQNGTFNILSTLNVLRDWQNNSNGTVKLSGGLLTGSTLTNAAGGFLSGAGTVSNILVNLGQVTATNGELRLANGLSGNGVYRAVAGGVGGTLTFANGGSISALFNTGATVRIEGPLTNTVSFVNQGTVSLAGGTYHSTAAFNNPAGTVSGFGTITPNLTSGGTITVTGAGITFAGSVTNSGMFSIGASSATLSSGLANSGTTSLGGGSIFGPGNVANTGTISGFGTIAPTVNNNGTIDVSGGTLVLNLAPVQSGRVNVASDGTLSVGTSWSNAGVVSLDSGRIATTGGDLTNLTGGTIQGNGTISGNVINQGTLSPGFSVGTLTLNDNLSLGSNSTVVIELSSLSSFDKVVVTGNATLGGNLQVILLGGYVPNPSDSWAILTATASLSGTFASVTDGYLWQIINNEFVLTAVPETNTVTLVLGGVLLLTVVMRRRRKV